MFHFPYRKPPGHIEEHRYGEWRKEDVTAQRASNKRILLFTDPRPGGRKGERPGVGKDRVRVGRIYPDKEVSAGAPGKGLADGPSIRRPPDGCIWVRNAHIHIRAWLMKVGGGA